jgi:hypothetical protein
MDPLALLHSKGALLSSTQNISLGWKQLKITSFQWYIITVVKSVIVQTWVSPIKLFFQIGHRLAKQAVSILSLVLQLRARLGHT